MANTRTLRTGWVDAGVRALAKGGPEAVRVEALARTLGVSKGGFYWHFSDRSALLKELLAEWERVLVDEVIAQVEAEPGDARAKLRRLFGLAEVGGVWLKVDLAVRDWARRDRAVARRLRRVDARRVDFMRSLFAQFCADPDDVEARCVLAMALFVGSHFLGADLDVALAASRLLA